MGATAPPLPQLEDHLGAHARPDHGLNLQHGQHAGYTPVMSDVVPPENPVLPPSDHAPQPDRQLSEPNTVARGAGSEGKRVVPEDGAVLPLSHAVGCVGLRLGDALCGIGGAELAGEWLRVALSRGEVVVVVV